LFLGLVTLTAETTPDDTQSAVVLPDPASIRFTPPPPPKEVPAMEVKDSTTTDFGTHRITILRGEPSTLPDIPDPPPPVEPDPEQFAELSEPTQLLFISGSTFGDSLSRVEIWNPKTQTRHIAWCGWDVSLIAPFHEIRHQGKPHFLLMGVGPGDTREEHPKVAPGSILVPDGDEYTAAILTSLRDACYENLPKLVELKAAREQYQRDAAAWHAANPPRPQNHTIWLKPHRGSRYLENYTGDKKEGAR
jgi:hypothetical protein